VWRGDIGWKTNPRGAKVQNTHRRSESTRSADKRNSVPEAVYAEAARVIKVTGHPALRGRPAARCDSGALLGTDAQVEFLRAVEQIGEVKTFPQANPRYLLNGGDFSKSLEGFKKVYCGIIARD
jgi:hypothetical protein